jgi:hypothetical protein
MRATFLILLFSVVVFTCKAQDTCKPMKIGDFPKKDLPPAGFSKDKLKAKLSKDYYYGIGVPIDYVNARYLAFKELEDSTSETIGGPAILMMLYANGYGVKKNFDISLRLACANIWSAPAELEYRTAHLKRLKQYNIDTVFSICDDITSGMMSGVCEDLNTTIQEWGRQRVLDSVTVNWPAKDTAALSKLYKVAEVFFNTRVNNEIDLSGTMRAAFQSAEQNALEKDFLNEIVEAGAHAFPASSDKDFAAADSMLNITYKQIMEKKVGPYDWGTVTKEGIKTTERKWIVYKEAWVKFGQVVCPGVSESSIQTFFTKQRMEELKDFLQ